MKHCSKCSTWKLFEEFHKSSTRGYQAWCKSCRKLVDKACWEKRKQNFQKMEEKKKYNKQRLNKTRLLIHEFLLKNACVDCGESDPVVLTFDHVRGQKLFNISNAPGRYSHDSVKEEIAKCEIRCFNCHVRKTAKQFNWYAYLKD